MAVPTSCPASSWFHREGPSSAGFFAALGLIVFLAMPGFGQSSLRLPLPVDSPPGVSVFESPTPVAAVLTGVLWPSSGPLTSWAPVYSTLGADGTLKGEQTGGWVGPRPEKWLKVVKRGFVVGGFRVLVKTGPAPPQTRQAQVFWKPWADGETRGPVVESPVYGARAGAQDTVRVVELLLPGGAVPTGLYGQTLGGAVVQASLVVRPSLSSQAAPPAPGSTRGPVAPSVPQVGPVGPVAPPALK